MAPSESTLTPASTLIAPAVELLSPVWMLIDPEDESDFPVATTIEPLFAVCTDAVPKRVAPALRTSS